MPLFWMKDIPWYEWLYKINKKWEIWSCPRTWAIKRRGKFLQPQYTKEWYVRVWLTKWKTKHYFIHRLLAKVFLPNPENKPEINHKNWIPSDNRLENLEWCTWSENNLHKYNVLRCKKSEMQKESCKKTGLKNSKRIMQLTSDWKLIKEYRSAQEAINETWITGVRAVARWVAPMAKGFIWKYVN